MNTTAFKRSPLRLVEGRGGGRYKELNQGEFDWVMGHHGFEKQPRSGGADHDKFVHKAKSKVVTVKPRNRFDHDILERNAKIVARELGDPHLRHHLNWDPSFLKKGGKAELPQVERKLSPEETAAKAAHDAHKARMSKEAEHHTKFGEKFKQLSTLSGGVGLPKGVDQIRGLRMANSAFKKARKAKASARLYPPKV